MAQSAGVVALDLTGDLNFDAGGLSTRFLIGKFIKELTAQGDTLTVVLQDDQGNETAFSWTPAAGTAVAGAQIFLTTATYDAAANQINLTIANPPSAISIGDAVLFIGPSNLDLTTEDLTVSLNVATEDDRPLLNVDLTPIHAVDLLPDRLYMAFKLFNNSVRSYAFIEPIHLHQLEPVKSRSITIDNSKVQLLNVSPVEIIPAPGPGKAIEVVRTKVEGRGADMLTHVGDGDTTSPDSQTVWFYSWFGLLFIDPTHTDRPILTVANAYGIFEGNPTPSNSILNYWLGGVLEGANTYRMAHGRQILHENRGLSAAMVFNAGSNDLAARYDQAAWDAMMATANDNQVTVEVEYYIHEL